MKRWIFGWLCGAALLSMASGEERFSFAILGDRTGEVQAGVYEQVWQEAAAESPAFVLSVGDSIQGGKDATAEEEWRAVQRIWMTHRRLPLYLAPGNHDVWSGLSEELFRKYAGHPAHYSFDYEQAHFTILDNSRSDQLAAGEIAFLEQDLKSHAAAKVKVIVSHRPSWIVPVAMRSSEFELHRLAKRYGVRYVIAGHVHQMIRMELDGITYLSVPSSGGHLRLSGRYEDGWFFAHGRAEVTGGDLEIRIEEVKAPLGLGRVTRISDWGMAGLLERPMPH